jgi:hypothetical protein
MRRPTQAGLYRDRMRRRTPLTAGAIAGFAGLVLLLLECLRTLFGTALGTVSTVLLFVGLGLVVIAGGLLVGAASADTVADGPDSPGDGAGDTATPAGGETLVAEAVAPQPLPGEPPSDG